MKTVVQRVTRAEVRVGIADLLIERLRLTQPWYRAFAVHRRARTWLDRVNAVLGDGRAISSRASARTLSDTCRSSGNNGGNVSSRSKTGVIWDRRRPAGMPARGRRSS